MKAAAIAAAHGWTFALTWDGLVEEACRRAELHAVQTLNKP